MSDPFNGPLTSTEIQELQAVISGSFSEKFRWFRTKCRDLIVKWEHGHERFSVNRTTVLEDSFRALMRLDPKEMRKIFRIEFRNEEALDSGGVSREWFESVSQALFNVDIGLFQFTNNDSVTYQINSMSGMANEEHLRYFHFAGRLFGKALLDGQTINCFLTLPLLKHITGTPITLTDLQFVDNALYESLIKMLQMSAEDVASLCLDFTVSQEGFGAMEVSELKPGGADVPVTSENVLE